MSQISFRLLPRAGRWNEMPSVITEEILDRLALRGLLAELPAKFNEIRGLLGA